MEKDDPNPIVSMFERAEVKGDDSEIRSFDNVTSEVLDRTVSIGGGDHRTHRDWPDLDDDGSVVCRGYN